MIQINVGIGDYAISQNPKVVIKTFGLGSCLALIALEPKIRAAGMMHIAMPSSEINVEKSLEKPAYFVDTAIPLMLKKMSEIGGNNRGEGLIIKLIGGSQVAALNQRFNIGKRNILAMRKFFWKLRIPISAEDTGGKISRTVCLDVRNGKISITSSSKKSWII